MALMYDVLWRWRKYLNRCMSMLALEAPGASSHFSMKPILVDLEERNYVEPIFSGPLTDLLAGKRASGKSGNGSNRNSSIGGGNPKSKVGAAGVGARVRVLYDAHLPALYIRYGEKFWNLLVGKVLPTLHGHVLCKNFHLCGV